MNTKSKNIFRNNSSQRSLYELVASIQELSLEIQQLYKSNSVPWIIGYSGGKDSTAVLQLVWNAIAQLPPEQRTKPIHVITTDTLVENPIVSLWVKNSLKAMEQAANEQKLPFETHLLQPDIKDTFWVNLIGKGYPAPRYKFRWCTERLKIRPSNTFLREIARVNGETILILGTRKAESSVRAANMARHEKHRVRDRLSPNSFIPSALVYSPIEDWRNDEVWLYLHKEENPWGYSNKELFKMYRSATEDNECPLVVDTTTPSCGGSRFGCWVCTLVEQDKSMEAMIQNDDEKLWMEPLLNLRDELDFRNTKEDPSRYDRELDKRDFRRMRGNVQLFERNHNGKQEIAPIPGPYIKSWRETLLRKVLEAQTLVRQSAPEEMSDITLITLEELSEIRRIWREEKHEFDDSLPRIYREVTEEIFRDPRPGADNSLLGSDEWSVLEEVCGDDSMLLELMAKLLDTERQYLTKARRAGIYEDLEKCFQTSSRDKENALQNARQNHNLKTAASSGDIEQVKRLWAEMKFKPQEKPTIQDVE